MIESKSIWFDGRLVPWQEAKVHVLTHTLHYGLGAFEGLRCYRGDQGSAVFRLKEHIDRLLGSLHVVQIRISYSADTLRDAVLETIESNELEECYIRPIVFIGYGEMGLYAKNNPVQVIIAVWPWGTYLGDEGLRNGIRVKISSFARHHVNVSLTRAKVPAHYVNSILAKQEARDGGFDEALLLDTEGYVAEGPGENIFIVRRGVLKTPTLSSVLEGITRDSILQLAQEEGIPTREDRLTRDDLYLADEAFFTGTAAEVTPIREVDGRQIGPGQPGPITRRLQQKFFDVVHGRDPRHREWLTPLRHPVGKARR